MYFLKIESEPIFTIVNFYQFKTGVRLALSITVKEIEEIYTFGIKTD